MSIDFLALLYDTDTLPLLGIEALYRNDFTQVKETERSSLISPLSPLSPLSSHTPHTPHTLIIAPHPDDETLGCGGTIALLRESKIPVSVLVISDGTKSHPNSRKYPAPALKNLREEEIISALSILNVAQNEIAFLGLSDGAVPMPGELEYKDAIARCRDYLTHLEPAIIFLPWRKDPHRDHRASWQLIYDASQYLSYTPRLIEYPIWGWNPQKKTTITESIYAWRLDISKVVEQKQQAIAQYHSQITNLIDDDPQGFRLAPEMLANFARPWEVFLEVQA
jgi:LmbE family N-acetylglucosaminyl deacetylase